MKNLLEEIKKQYAPSLAIVVYESKESGGYADDYYLESHVINNAGQLLEGKPLKSETIAGMVDIFRDRQQQETRISGDIPTCLLHYAPGTGGEYRLIWHRPAGQRMMYFTPELKLKSGLAMVPPVLFVATAAHLKIFTLASGRRPSLKTKVYAAPFHNVSGDGRVCLGSAKVKAPAVKSFSNLIAYWEELFWGSKFSAVHNDRAVSGGMNKLWAAQVRRKDRPFPMNLLAKPTLTFHQLLHGKGNNS